MRILLIRPPQPRETHGVKNLVVTEPLELEYVAAGVSNHCVRIHDMLVSDEPIEGILKKFNPHIVGTTCYINTVWEALDICRRCKRFNSTIKTVVGGVHACLNPSDFEYDFIDFIVKGEGITTFKDLMACMEDGNKYQSVKGIGYNSDGVFLFTEPRPFPHDIEKFPFPDRKLTQKYHNEYSFLNLRPLTIMRTAWGCPFKCNFCYNRELTDNHYLARSPESVVAELETIQSKYVFIIDDTFFFNRKRLNKIYDLIKERGIKKEFISYGRTDFLANNKDILEKWAEIGMILIRVGIEGLTDEELGNYNKKNTIANNNKALEVCREVGIDISASFIIPPHYDKKDFDRLEKYIIDQGLLYVFMNLLTPLPGTDFCKDYKDQLIIPHNKSYPLWDFQHCVIMPTKMPLKSFYRRLALIYLKMANPFRAGKLKSRGRMPDSIFSLQTLKLYHRFTKVLIELFWAHRQHNKVLKDGHQLKK